MTSSTGFVIITSSTGFMIIAGFTSPQKLPPKAKSNSLVNSALPFFTVIAGFDGCAATDLLLPTFLVLLVDGLSGFVPFGMNYYFVGPFSFLR